MINYKLINNEKNQMICIGRSDGWFIPLINDNTDYANFKKQINADEAQLEDADGNLMSTEQAKAYVATLP